MADKYEFDPTMSIAANRVRGEQHVITSVNFRDYHYIIPEFAPFFSESLVLAMRYPNGQVRPLIEGKDYYLGFHFIDASSTTDHPVYGAISFLDTDTEGVLTIDYHTVGGKWTLTPAQIIEILANNLRNPRITTWEQVVNPPERFPPINHTHDIVDFKTMADVQEAVDRVRDAILAASGGGLSAHTGNYANPHNVTKAQIGLSLVQNYPIATTTHAQSGAKNDVYMTPIRVKEAISVFAGDLLQTHTTLTNNPHGVTKAQIGLGSVQNYGIATLEEALDGTATNKYMTPQRTKSVVDVVNSSLISHLINKDNPHEVTKDHVGLFNLENYPVASQQEAMAGTRHDRYMTPIRTTQLVAEYVYDAMRGHTDLTNNPHGVSKQQVGLGNVQNYEVATLEEAMAGNSNARYMTPYLVRATVAAVSGDLGNHALDDGNPHNVTASQVGAYTKSETDLLLRNYLNINGKAVDSTLWNGRDELEYAHWLAGSGVSLNAATLSGMSYNDIGNDILSRVGNSFAKQYVAADNGNRADPGTLDELYWVRIHVATSDMLGDSSRDGVAIITGGSGRTVYDGQLGNNCVMVRSTMRGAEEPTALVNVVSLLPTPIAKPLVFGYTVDQQTKTLTTWARLSAVSTNLLITEFGTNISVESDGKELISETEPAGIIYVNPVSAFDNSATAIQIANTANTTANTANSTANAASATASAAVSTANTANTTANSANSTAGSANSVATAASNKVDALELRIVQLENRLDAITIS